jgi:hypothetical protein
MKPSVKIVACMVFLISLLAVSCESLQTTESETAAVESEPVGPENELIGVWKVVEVTKTGPEARTITNLQPVIAVFTKKYNIAMGVRGETPRPELPENPTDAQLVAAWRPVTAIAATYNVQGNIITSHDIVGKDPNIKPDNIFIREYKIEGDTLIITSDQDPNAIIKLTRLE